jgi:signal transduction histidine kinase
MITDWLTYAAIFLFMGIIAWSLNREIKRSKEKTYAAEKNIAEERYNIKKQLEERTSELEVSERLRKQELERVTQFGQLSQGLFHDLMSPLTSVALYVERLDTKDDVVQKAVEASRRMRTFMESVKRCLGNSTSMVGEKTDLAQEIMIAKDVMAYKARMANVEIDVDKIGEITLNIHPIRIHQILLNLLSNAIDACIGSGVISISAQKKSDEVILSIEDNGSGIDPEHLDMIFKKSFTTKSGGTGIGLTTVKSIVENDLHGSIRVESKVGKGTKFVITMPVSR